MKLLVYENRKSPAVYYQIDTPEQELAAYLLFFKTLDGYWACYEDATGLDKQLVEKARTGDGEAAKKLLRKRRDYEYEEVQVVEAKDPLKTKGAA